MLHVLPFPQNLVRLLQLPKLLLRVFAPLVLIRVVLLGQLQVRFLNLLLGCLRVHIQHLAKLAAIRLIGAKTRELQSWVRPADEVGGIDEHPARGFW